MTGTSKAALPRSLSLPLVVLYGLGITVGAGIYVLIGAAAGSAGPYASTAFVLAAIVMGLTGASFAELAGRYPVSAGEAAYVRHAWNSEPLALCTGVLVLAVALISGAAIAKGSAGYLKLFVPLDETLLAVTLILLLGGIAAFGTKEALGFAAVLTLIELSGLVIIISAGLWTVPGEVAHHALVRLPLDTLAWQGVLQAFYLAFFAFIGFEAVVNLAEDSEEPARVIPLAILGTLVVTTVLYCAVVATAMAVVPRYELAASSAPLSLVFQRATNASPLGIAAIAVIATANGIIGQIILAARMLYGLSRQGNLPSVLSDVNHWTGTPLLATAISTAITALLALSAGLGRLAELTSFLMLAIFAMVNAALLVIKQRRQPAPVGIFIAPYWVPVIGAASSVLLLGAAVLR